MWGHAEELKAWRPRPGLAPLFLLVRERALVDWHSAAKASVDLYDYLLDFPGIYNVAVLFATLRETRNRLPKRKSPEGSA